MTAGLTKVKGNLTEHIESDRHTVLFGLHYLLVTGPENHQQKEEDEEADPLEFLPVYMVDE